MIILAVLLTAALLLSLCTAGLVFVARSSGRLPGGGWPPAEAQGATAAARRCVVGFLTVSAKHVTRDMDRVAQCATGEFAKQYEDGSAEVRDAVLENQVESTGKVLESAVVKADADSTVVLVAVDATIKNTHTPNGRKAHYRVQVDMALRNGTWKISRLDFVG